MLNVKRPAHSGLVPETIAWRQPTQYEVGILQDYLCCDTKDSLQKRGDAQHKSLVGYYRSISSDSAFIKVLPSVNSETLINAEKISSWLYHSGLSINHSRAGFPKKIEGHDLWIFAYDYIDYDFSSGSVDQLYFIGKELGRMHRLLKEYPDRENVRVRGVKKNQFLLEQIKKVRMGAAGLNFPKSAIELIQKTGESEYQMLTLSAQMIHGDMNYGNVLFNKVNNQPVIIDFEDATASWLSPLYDLAFVIQRFVLLDKIKDRFELASALIKGYASQNKVVESKQPNALFIMIKMISIRSLLVLSSLPDEEQIMYSDEVEKFIDLYRQAQGDSILISDIDALIN